MTSAPRKILPAYILNSANSNIRHIQARAAAHVVSTARNVLPAWTASYLLPATAPPSSPAPPDSPHPLDPDSPSSPTEHPTDGAAATDPASVDPSLRDRLAGFDVLRGQDVLVSVKDHAFTVFHVGDRAGDLEELCAYTCSHPILALKVLPCIDTEVTPRAVLLTQTDVTQVTLSVVQLSATVTTEASIVLPKHIITTSLLVCEHYIAIATPKTVNVYKPSDLSLITAIPVPSATITGSARWLIYTSARPNPALPFPPLLDTPPETPFVERMARGLTRGMVSWGRDTGERITEAVTSYLAGPQPPTPEKKRRAQPLTSTSSSSRTTLLLHDIPTDTVLAQFQVPYKLGFVSLSGTMLFCSPPKGDEFHIYSLSQVPAAVHLVATFSRGYTYSRVIQVTWRPDHGCLGVISAHGTAHVFSLKRRGKETARAVGKVKIDGGVKGVMFVKRLGPMRRRSSTTANDMPDLLTVANIHERATSWKLTAATRSISGMLTSLFNPPTIVTEEAQSTPHARPIADYLLPTSYQSIPFPSLSASPVIKAAFTNQSPSTDCTAKAEVECSISTRGLNGVRCIRLFEYTSCTPFIDFGSPLPFTQREIDLGIPRGQVRYVGDNTLQKPALETPPSSEGDSPDFAPDDQSSKKKRRKPVAPQSEGIEKAISASLGTELDKTRMVSIPPTPPGSFSTPKMPSSEWVGDILDRGKTMVRNVRRGSSIVPAGKVQEELHFEDGVEVLSLEDAPLEEESESGESEASRITGKVRGDASVLGHWEA